MTRGPRAYQQVRVNTATPGELVVLLYEGLARFTTVGRRALESRMYADAGTAFDRAMQIIGYLREVLDHDPAPELAARLDLTYEAWSRVIVRAQIERDVDALDLIISQMDEMTESWRVANTQAPQHAEGA